MSSGSHCESVRHLVLKNSTNMVWTGYRRINVKKYILDVPHDVFDILEIDDICFSASEWEQIKDYVDEARDIGKIVTFNHCNIYEDDFISRTFFAGELEPSLDKHKLVKKNNYDGVRYHSTESIKEWVEAKGSGDMKKAFTMLDGEKI